MIDDTKLLRRYGRDHPITFCARGALEQHFFEQVLGSTRSPSDNHHPRLSVIKNDKFCDCQTVMITFLPSLRGTICLNRMSRSSMGSFKESLLLAA